MFSLEHNPTTDSQEDKTEYELYCEMLDEQIHGKEITKKEWFFLFKGKVRDLKTALEGEVA